MVRQLLIFLLVSLKCFAEYELHAVCIRRLHFKEKYLTTATWHKYALMVLKKVYLYSWKNLLKMALYLYTKQLSKVFLLSAMKA